MSSVTAALRMDQRIPADVTALRHAVAVTLDAEVAALEEHRDHVDERLKVVLGQLEAVERVARIVLQQQQMRKIAQSK